MVDTHRLFQKLSRGASFKKDDPFAGLPSKKPKLTEEEVREKQRRIKKALDFFGDEDEETVTSKNSNETEPCTKELRVERCLEQGYDDTKKSKDSGRMRMTKKRRIYSDKHDANKTDGSSCSDDSRDSSDDGDSSEEGDTSDTSDDNGVMEEDEHIRELKGLPMNIKLFSNRDKLLSADSVKTVAKKKTKTDKVLDPIETKKRKIMSIRHCYHIYVNGDDIPDPITTFDDIKQSVPSYILRNLVNMGYKQPTPVQMQTIPLLFEGREISVCAPTGSGKTAAFAIPIIAHLKAPSKVGIRAIVVCPTRELALQTQREFGRLCRGSGFRIHVLTGLKSTANNLEPSSKQRIDVLVTTPIRLIKLLSNEQQRINVQNVEWLILDESDKLFEDGTKGFKKQTAEIYSACDHPGIKHALFSATRTTGVEQFCKVHFDSCVQVTIGKVNTTADVKQQLLFVGQETGKLLAVRDIIHKGFTPPVLIFVQSVDRAKQLFHELIYDGMNVDVIHSERTQAQRDNVIKSFREGKIWILICTDLMGRGIDFKGVNMVINYDFPPNAISYIHRIGRTGRAGRKGEAITFFTEDDVKSLRSIASVMRNSGCEVPEWMLQLRKSSKSKRKAIAKKPIERKDIRTVPKYDIDKKKKRSEMIAASKKRKMKLKKRNM